MARHDEPNEYGFAGETTAPEPPARGRPDARDEAERVAVPGDDLTAEFSEALPDGLDEDRADAAGSAGRDRPDHRSARH
ncbi:hypothetical protein ACFFWC_19695 [Plantactinospora siamensis]|uniref:DUF5709 domain-containing protein n=1 Tax=Plantactinospora siamensis TaxID=555372 RepID=A0ABV6P2J2_9ACTN